MRSSVVSDTNTPRSPASFWRRRIVGSWIAFIFAAVVFVPRGLAQDHPKGPRAKAPATKVTVDRGAAVHIPPLVLPFSSFASPEAKAAFLKFVEFYGTCFPKAASVAEKRQMEFDHLRPTLRRVNDLYPVDSVATTIARVYTDVITPRDGIAPRNKGRVLINLHGGGFMTGARILGALESIPVASHGQIKVVAVGRNTNSPPPARM